MQRSAGCGEPSLSGYICSKAPASPAQGTLRKSRQKDSKSQNPRKSAVGQPPLGRATLTRREQDKIIRHANRKGEKYHGVLLLDKELEATKKRERKAVESSG